MIFVVNCGSSSLKWALIGDHERDAGLVEVRGEDGHEQAVAEALDAVGAEAVEAVAHRVVHGGERFSEPVLVDDDVLAAIRELSALAPLHNPVNAVGIEVARRALPSVPHVAVFDTAFHATLPPHAYTYAVPRSWQAEHGVRRYGFHGTSHAYVAREAARLVGRAPEEANVIVLHLGNGASACAVRAGRSVETSMGLTPLEGLVMGSRSGDLDPAVIPHMARAGLSLEEIDRALNGASGLRALAGTNDLREIAPDDLALDVYCHRIRKYVGAYLAVLGRVHALAFTAGVGEHSAGVRARSLSGLERLGIVLDEERNAAGGPTVSADGSAIPVLVVPTDEELEMATQARAVLALSGGASCP